MSTLDYLQGRYPGDDPLARAAARSAETVRVRVPVAVWPDGEWVALEYADLGDDPTSGVSEKYSPGWSLVWVTADVPVPRAVEVAGEAEAKDR